MTTVFADTSFDIDHHGGNTPSREHLSQAFARFFMRVGLPTPIETVW